MNNIGQVIEHMQELAWSAGFYDGEGSTFTFRNDSIIVMAITQTDRGPLERFQKAIGGIGKIYGPYHEGNVKWKPHWLWRTSNKLGDEGSLTVLRMLYPFLCLPKRLQIATAVHEHNEYRRLVCQQVGSQLTLTAP